jgi:transcriptional regulator with XRE-family HTH domain
MNSSLSSVDIRVVAARAKAARLRQEDIAEAVGASQSQVSRVLSGRCTRQTQLMDGICSYVNLHACPVAPDDVRNNELLISALADTWDGSERHAHALASVIRELALLRGGRERCSTHKNAPER